MKIKNKFAFTLIELIIVIVILGIISLILAPVILTGINSWEYIHYRTDSINNARLAMNRMVREIREVKSPSDITTWNPNKITFTHINGVNITFEQSGSTLLRNNDDLIDNLQSPNGLQFFYLDSAGGTAASASGIRRIKIKLILTNDAGTFNIQSQVYIRNL